MMFGTRSQEAKRNEITESNRTRLKKCLGATDDP